MADVINFASFESPRKNTKKWIRCLYFALDPWRFDILIRLCCGPCPPLSFQNMVIMALNVQNFQMIDGKSKMLLMRLWKRWNIRPINYMMHALLHALITCCNMHWLLQNDNNMNHIIWNIWLWNCSYDIWQVGYDIWGGWWFWANSLQLRNNLL